MKNKDFYSKILLFGEYGIIKNSSGLSIPFKKFNGRLKLNDKLNGKSEGSNLEIQKFYEYIKANTNDLGRFNLQSLKEDISNGLYFDSDIPKGFGVGSSGALVAAIYDKYCDSDTDDLYELKKIFSTMESYFHGNSSGLDPLVSFFNNPIFISEDAVELLTDIEFLNSKIYLIDSKYSSNTKEMIELFNNKMNDKDFSNFFNKSYINKTNECIANLLNSSNYYRDSIKKLSEITYKNMNEMIPDSLKEIWNEGLKSDSFYMKLCGSGGGGFFLVFDFENKVKDKLDKFKLFEV